MNVSVLILAGSPPIQAQSDLRLECLQTISETYVNSTDNTLDNMFNIIEEGRLTGNTATHALIIGQTRVIIDSTTSLILADFCSSFG